MFRTRPEHFDPKGAPPMKTVRIVCISDTHTETNNLKIPQCDILIHAGDITYRGELDKLAKFNDWARTVPAQHKIVVAGNHDISLEKSREVAEALLTNWTYLRDSLVTVCGLKIYGTPWSPSFFPEHWVFNQNRGSAAKKRWEQIPDDIDVLIVHGPPYGYGDRVEAGVNVGCVDLADRLQIVRPKLTVCGHIHEDPGVFAAPWGMVVNASIMTAGYKPSQKPVSVTLRIPIPA